MSAAPTIERPSVARKRQEQEAQPRLRVVRGKAPARFHPADAIQTLAVFAVVFVLAYSGSTLIGKSLGEQARRQAIQANERAVRADREVARLRVEVDSLSSFAESEKWATARGFLPPGGLVVRADGPGTGGANGTL